MRIEVNGRQVACDDTGGAGVPLVLVHGFPLDRTVWADQTSGLADVARVVAIDLPGFGGSDAPLGPVTVDAYADHVRDTLDALGLGTVVLGGVSMGGYVAMAFHRRHPARLRGLVLVDTRAGADSAEAKKARDAAIALARAEGAGAIAAQMIGKLLTPAHAAEGDPLRTRLLAMMGAQPRETVVAALGALRDRPDASASIRTIAVPTLVVSGADDLIIPPTEAAAMHAAIPASRLAILPGAAHLPNVETPGQFNAAVRSFLAAFPTR